MSEKHQQALMNRFPQVQFSFFENICEARPMLKQAEVLVTYGEDLTDQTIGGCPALKWIMVISAGLELMPFQAIQERNILVTNARGIHAVPMSEYVMAVMLQITRRTNEFLDLQRSKRWDRSIRIGELFGKTLVVIGAGAIGQAIAQKAKAFGMVTVGVNTEGSPRPHFDEMKRADQLAEVLGKGDFIVLTVPLTQQTKGMIGEKELALMKPSAYLINIARGAVIDEQALVKALEQKQIAGAVLDVYEQEPLPPDHPFWSLDHVILTPHISARSPMYMTRALEIFHHNLQVYLNQTGDYINLIDVNKGY